MSDSEQQVRDRQKLIWSLGDYARIAEILQPAAQTVVDACNVGPGSSVLDVGAGTGNLAVEAGRCGASVVAVDLTPHLIEIGRARSEEEGLEIEWHEADAENLPFDDDVFDVTASVFAAMFAPRADAVVAEMARVTKPGGIMAFTAWHHEGYTAQTLALSTRYAPPLPDDVDTPGEWGDPDVARARFERHASQVEVRRETVVWEFESLDEAQHVMETSAPPLVAAKMVLEPDRFDDMMRGYREIQQQFNRATDGSVVIDADYVLVLARKPA